MTERTRIATGSATVPPESSPEQGRSEATNPSPGEQRRSSERECLAAVLEAGLVLAALPCLRARGLPHPKAMTVVEEIGVSRARAYEVRGKLLAMLPALLRPVGRPPRPPSSAPPADLAALAGAVRDYLMEHPGAAETGPRRQRYTDPFRLFILELRERHADLHGDDFARAVGVPARTIIDWMRAGPIEEACEQADPPADPAAAESGRMYRIQMILSAWEKWRGSFAAFCMHVEEHLGIPYKRTLIARILEESGARIPRRRRGRSPDELALKKQFETFFPGAQWCGDGTPLTVDVAGESFPFNLELIVDPDSGAAVGLSLGDEEDSRALVEAFEDAVQTAGKPPLALLVDNRPSNHTEEVDEALGETLRTRATSKRPQNKAHCEGALGLFSQVAPLLAVPSLRPVAVAYAFLLAVVTTWARTLNHKPRRDRGGRSRVELYLAADPTPEEVEDARRKLLERTRKQEEAWRTRKARQDPIVRKSVDDAFERLGLSDPEEYLRTSIARYPLHHVLEGIAIYEAKATAGTLPRDVDARYLLGIVRNIAEEDEGVRIAEALWRARLAARDEILLALDGERQTLSRATGDLLELIRRLTDRATAHTRAIDRAFWLRALADAINAQPEGERESLFRLAARRIHATHRIPHKDRLACTRRLAAMLLPFE